MRRLLAITAITYLIYASFVAFAIGVGIALGSHEPGVVWAWRGKLLALTALYWIVPLAGYGIDVVLTGNLTRKLFYVFLVLWAGFAILMLGTFLLLTLNGQDVITISIDAFGEGDLERTLALATITGTPLFVYELELYLRSYR